MGNTIKRMRKRPNGVAIICITLAIQAIFTFLVTAFDAASGTVRGIAWCIVWLIILTATYGLWNNMQRWGLYLLILGTVLDILLTHVYGEYASPSTLTASRALIKTTKTMNSAPASI